MGEGREEDMGRDMGAPCRDGRAGAEAPEPVKPSRPVGGIPSAELHFSQGSVTAHVGQRFGFWDGTVWEIVEFRAERTYSPSGFGGTPTVLVRHIFGELTPHMQQYMEDGCTDWCGDSVAAGIHYYDSYIPTHLRPLACRGCGSTKTREELAAAGWVNCCPERAMNEVIEARHGIPALTPGGVDPTAQVGTRPEGGDCLQAPSETSDAVGEADAPKLRIPGEGPQP